MIFIGWREHVRMILISNSLMSLVKGFRSTIQLINLDIECQILSFEFLFKSHI